MAVAPPDQAEQGPGARAQAGSRLAHRFRRAALVHQPVRLCEDGSIQEMRAADVVAREPDDAVRLDPLGGVVDATPATLGRFLLVEQPIFRRRLALGRKGLAGELREKFLLGLQPLASGGQLAGLVGRVPEPVHHEAVHLGHFQSVGDRLGKIVEVGVRQRQVKGGGRPVA